MKEKYYKEFKKITNREVKRYEGYIHKISSSQYSIAIVGKVKAGKSTFINALLGNNFLPTDILQNTSSIIEISHSDEPHLIVSRYLDDSPLTFKGTKEQLESKLIELGSLIGKDKFRNLPIRFIDEYIEQNRGRISEENILELVDLIKERDKDLNNFEVSLREYLKENSTLKNSPKSLNLKIPLSKEFKDVKIIDTPGVNARGDIEEITYKRMKESNAKILVHSITDVEEKSFEDFAKKLLNELPDEIGSQLFVVFTHTGELNDSGSVERLFEKAKDIFRDKIDDEKILWVDSLNKIVFDDLMRFNKLDDLVSFYNEERRRLDVRSSEGKFLYPGKREFILTKLKTLNELMASDNPDDIYSRITDIEFLRAKAISYSNFDVLEARLAKFVTSEPLITVNKFLSEIETDYVNIMDENAKNIELLKIQDHSLLKKKLTEASKEMDDLKSKIKSISSEIDKKYLGENSLWKNKASEELDQLFSDLMDDLRGGKKKKFFREQVINLNRKLSNVLSSLYDEIYKDIYRYFSNLNIAKSLNKRDIVSDESFYIDIDPILDRAKKKAISKTYGSYETEEDVYLGRQHINESYTDGYNFININGHIDWFGKKPKKHYYEDEEFDRSVFVEKVKKDVSKSFQEMSVDITNGIADVCSQYKNDLFEQMQIISKEREKVIKELSSMAGDNEQKIQKKNQLIETNQAIENQIKNIQKLRR